VKYPRPRTKRLIKTPLRLASLVCLLALTVSKGVAGIEIHGSKYHQEDSQRKKADEKLMVEDKGVKIWWDGVHKNIDIVNDSGRNATISYIFAGVSGTCKLGSAQSATVTVDGHYTGNYEVNLSGVSFDNW
jgi:hypothetical protein